MKDNIARIADRIERAADRYRNANDQAKEQQAMNNAARVREAKSLDEAVLIESNVFPITMMASSTSGAGDGSAAGEYGGDSSGGGSQAGGDIADGNKAAATLTNTV